MNYLLIGEDSGAKDDKIAEIKAGILSSLDAAHFDYEILHGTKCDPGHFKKVLLALPAIAKKRLVLIRSANKLSTQNKKILSAFIKDKQDHLDLIIDVDAEDSRSSFLKNLIAASEVTKFAQARQQNVFDITNAMTSRRPIDALKILYQVVSEGAHPLQVMGGLVWFWGKNRNRLSHDHFKQGLLDLSEADLNIKRSKLKPEYALEVLVIKLSSLLAY